MLGDPRVLVLDEPPMDLIPKALQRSGKSLLNR